MATSNGLASKHMTIDTLKTALDRLSDSSLDVTAYERELSDVVFDVTTVDTFVAGIATTILEGGRPRALDVVVLRRAFLVDDAWLLDDGRRLDLGSAPEVLAHARRVELVREACLRRLAD